MDVSTQKWGKAVLIGIGATALVLIAYPEAMALATGFLAFLLILWAEVSFVQTVTE